MMLPSSVRRVVSAAPQSSLLSNLSSSSPRAPAALALCCNTSGQQRRRYSSSKPSSPNDSPKGIPDGQVTASPSQSSKQSGEKRRRKTKEWMDIQQKLPSVPSTQHVPQEALALSTFFSLHRPMSVTHSFPRTITDDAFAQIFTPRTKNNKYADVMSTLSRTVDELEQPMQNLDLDGQQSGETITGHNGELTRKIDLKHPDGTESSVYVQLNAMSGQFLPFRPPPLPQNEATAKAETAHEEVEDVPQHRVYKAMFTLEETTDENGQIRIVAHSPEVIEEPSAPKTFLERMALRQIRWREEVRGQSPDMHAISVRRQRKLKMKKKKYKKLMKRTRNIRRKLDRV
ncbi:hypothetical protein F4815DRAFT_496891 [Daldinia loculata]|uniref:uncharacterized protein n=1 Tax=Daldinia loculata TaxID=103429 RepID=UPI0020C27866|nr:uncharacterized protein F4817DRAFT_358457 [Daldinia loculata]KAI1647609.1 hypothetical protein F4817DRAFT_358457 [Daldinia loculata]KAI2771286.1 hypothetical protein F4815DRAFT_496891 [Daldinia loculata]